MFETAKSTDQHRVLSGGSLHSKETMSSPMDQLLYTASVCVYTYIMAEGLRLEVELCRRRIGQLRGEAEVGKLHASSQEEHCGRRRRCRDRTCCVRAGHVKQTRCTDTLSCYFIKLHKRTDIQEVFLRHTSYMRDAVV